MKDAWDALQQAQTVYDLAKDAAHVARSTADAWNTVSGQCCARLRPRLPAEEEADKAYQERAERADDVVSQDKKSYESAQTRYLQSKASESGGGGAAGPKEVTVSRGRHPESAQHIEDAQAAGQPTELTVDRAGAAARRKASVSGTEPVPGKDRDEYPPAMFGEGGRGSSVRPITPGDNRGAGACIGAQCRGLPNGTKVVLKVKP